MPGYHQRCRRSKHVALGLVALCLLACGGGDDSDEDDSGSQFGTCNLRSVVNSCIESSGPAAAIENQREGCTEAGGLWSAGACPDDMLIGCCSYTFGLQFRECFYEGSATTDPEAYCTTMWEDGVWTPGP